MWRAARLYLKWHPIGYLSDGVRELLVAADLVGIRPYEHMLVASVLCQVLKGNISVCVVDHKSQMECPTFIFR